MLRGRILETPALLLGRCARAAEIPEVLTAGVRPPSIAEGPRRRSVLGIVAEATWMTGR